ncbi:uncharacterized protein LOC125667910 isoform X3 [Ostrea edulis]|uniref:uncharacterized protein LOC125667910 isoform X3 n=1 Tax=Ostrea edulis TaxID=37623 RepID=UPI0024AF6950|nr:uncharacterized protein LOC125667910 isoform X3 [Ostrea edulis]
MMKSGSNGYVHKEEIMMNLLDDSSESDELQLAPLKGKKQVRRKRNAYAASPSPAGICNWWQFIKMLVVLLLVCSVTVMGFITVWLSGQVKDLQQQLNEVKDTGPQTTADDLQQQVQKNIQKTLVNVTKSPQEIEALKQRITTLTSKVDSLSTAISAVSKVQPGSQQIVKEVNELHSEIPIISKTVANLGVDVKTMKSTVDELLEYKKTVEKELADMKLQQSGKSVSGGREAGGRETSPHVDLDTDSVTKLQNMGDMIQVVNNSLWSELPKIRSRLSSHEAFLGVLQNVTASMQKDLKALTGDHSSILKDHSNMDHGSGGETEQTKLLIHQVLDDMGLANQTNPSRSLDSLTVKIDNITATVNSLRDQYKMMKESEGGTGSVDTASMQTSLQALNMSVESLKTDFNTLMTKVTKHSNMLINLSKIVEVLQHFSTTLDKDHRNILSGQSTTSISPSPGFQPTSREVETPSVKPTTRKGESSSTKLKTEAAVPTTPISTTKGKQSTENKPPLAQTDGHLTLTLPVKEIPLNGINSTDDKGIMLYHWEQIGGHPLEIAQTDEAATAASGDIVAGQYMFELQVWDEENLSSTMKLFVDVEDDGKKVDGHLVSSTASVKPTAIAPKFHRYINMSLVKTYEDLDVGVRRWDRNGDGLVNAQDLPDYMGDPPKPKQLEKFDFNRDGLYSIDELAVALGFQPWPKDQPEPQDDEKQ